MTGFREVLERFKPQPKSDGGLAKGVGKVLNKPEPKPEPKPETRTVEPKSPAPWYEFARSYIGKKEVPGSSSDKEIAEWLREAGEKGDDAIPWCAAFVGAMLNKAGFAGTGSASARSYLKYGLGLEKPIEGCIVVFWRESPESYKGHVGFYVRQTESAIIVLGGNQSNAVNESAYPKSRVLGYRWPTVLTRPKPDDKITTGQDADEGTPSWYRRMFAACEIDKGYEGAVANDVSTVLRGEARYKAVEGKTGVPWWIIGAIHFKEASCNFEGVLHSGERGLIGPKAMAENRKSTIVPKGVGPFETWEDSAVHALKESGRWKKIADGGRDIGDILYAAERFNGTGYISGAGRKETTPYLWARSNINDGFGKYVRDGEYDSSASTNKTTGLALILKELQGMGKAQIS